MALAFLNQFLFVLVVVSVLVSCQVSPTVQPTIAPTTAWIPSKYLPFKGSSFSISPSSYYSYTVNLFANVTYDSVFGSSFLGSFYSYSTNYDVFYFANGDSSVFCDDPLEGQVSLLCSSSSSSSISGSCYYRITRYDPMYCGLTNIPTVSPTYTPGSPTPIPTTAPTRSPTTPPTSYSELQQSGTSKSNTDDKIVIIIVVCSVIGTVIVAVVAYVVQLKCIDKSENASQSSPTTPSEVSPAPIQSLPASTAGEYSSIVIASNTNPSEEKDIKSTTPDAQYALVPVTEGIEMIAV